MDFSEPDGIITFITEALPDAVVDTADEAGGAPEIAWGDTFVYTGRNQRMPFATIVTKDYPDFDTESNLDRAGVFRLNIGVGKARFAELLGPSPAEPDYTAFDRLVPHPVYAAQAWVSIVNPGPATTELAASLLIDAHARATGQNGPSSQLPRDSGSSLV